MLLEELMYKIESMTTIPFKEISLKVVEETMIRRIDRQIFNRDNPTIKNTLKDLKIIENSAILVEKKDENEVDVPDTVVLDPGKIVSKDEVIDIDETENIRTVIVNHEFDQSDFTRY